MLVVHGNVKKLRAGLVCFLFFVFFKAQVSVFKGFFGNFDLGRVCHRFCVQAQKYFGYGVWIENHLLLLIV